MPLSKGRDLTAATSDEMLLFLSNRRNLLQNGEGEKPAHFGMMARGGMRVGEVLKLTPGEVDSQKLVIQSTTQRYLAKVSDSEATR